MKEDVVGWTPEEQAELVALTTNGTCTARVLKRALVLPAAGDGDTDVRIAQQVRVHPVTVQRIRRRCVEGRVTAALSERPRPEQARKMGGRQEAHLPALACTPPPDGRKRWAMRPLANQLAESRVVGAIGDETVRRTLRRGAWSRGRTKPGASPRQHAGLVAAMEDVPDLYEWPENPRRPVVCFGAWPYPLVSETRAPQPPRPGRAGRYDDGDKREGMANLPLRFAPKPGWRHVAVTDRRAARDFAQRMRALVGEHCPEAGVIRPVSDTLDTHTPAALDEAFPPAKARRILCKLEFHDTPKHGSWLNQAEIELSVLSGQCLNRRIGDRDTLAAAVAAWERRRNEARATVQWRFTSADPRVKLHHVYPTHP